MFAFSFVGGGSAGLLRPVKPLGVNLSRGFSPYVRGGTGVFGMRGLKIGNYRINALYANPAAGPKAGTIFSLKQMKQGGAIWRWDYGVIHKTGNQGLHSTVRFYINGNKYGSTGQRYWYPSDFKAPFYKTIK